MYIAKLINKIKQLFNPDKPVENKAELLNLIRKLEKQSVIKHSSLTMLEGVLQTEDMLAEEIMIPKAQMFSLKDNASLEEILPIVIESAHSRLPVFSTETEKEDKVVGILLAKDIIPFVNDKSRNFNLKELLRTPVTIPENKKLYMLLNEFRLSRSHIAMVVNEYGEVTGLITIEDVLEQIVGNIEDEHDIDEEFNILKHDENRFSVKAITTIEDFNAYFSCNFDTRSIDTVAGLLLQQANKLPKRGETFTIANFKFTILRADKRRIHLVRVQRI